MGLFSRIKKKKEYVKSDTDDPITKNVINQFNDVLNNIPEEKHEEFLKKYIEVTEKEIDEKKRQLDQDNKDLDLVIELQNQAKKLEKTDIEQALLLYRNCINTCPFVPNPYERSIILNNKKKNYEESLRICDLAIENIGNKQQGMNADYFRQRREKILKKIDKN